MGLDVWCVSATLSILHSTLSNDGKPAVVEYEPDTDVASTLSRSVAGGRAALIGFLRREVLPYAADAWYQLDTVKIGYEISFARCFYKPQPMRTVEEIRTDILVLERETEGLLAEVVGVGAL